MSEEKLVLSIKSRKEDDGKRKPSNHYKVKLNDWDLGRGVTKLNLDMPANGIPKLTIECFVDEIEIDGLVVDKNIAPLDVLTRDQESSKKELPKKRKVNF